MAKQSQNSKDILGKKHIGAHKKIVRAKVNQNPAVNAALSVT